METHHAEKDRQRDEYLHSLGLMVLRFNSRQVLKEIEATMEFIYRTIAEQITN